MSSKQEQTSDSGENLVEPPPPTGKAKGGHARAEVLSPEKRSEIAKKAARSRWKSGALTEVTHAGQLHIGTIEIDCVVLADGRRLLSQRAVGRALGRSRGGEDYRRRQGNSGGELPEFLGARNLKPFISNELHAAVINPIFYTDKRIQNVAYGIEAQLLPQICDVWLKARDAGALKPIQMPVAKRVDILMRGLAHVGIIALVDEATGYQRDRATDALARILEAFIAKELQPYVPTFPGDYYEQLFRLRGLDFKTDSVKRPQYFGKLTNDIIYRRLAPGVLEELKKVVRRNESGRPTQKYFQSLTSNKGYPKLNQHLGAVVAIMKLSTDYYDFMDKLNGLCPRYGQNMFLPFEAEGSTDDGKGL